MQISASGSQSLASSAQTASLTALKSAREAPGKAALKILDGIAEQVQQPTNSSGSVGRNVNAKA